MPVELARTLRRRLNELLRDIGQRVFDLYDNFEHVFSVLIRCLVDCLISFLQASRLRERDVLP